jgi:hypothetical protein
MSRRTKARKWRSFAGTTLVISVVARLKPRSEDSAGA